MAEIFSHDKQRIISDLSAVQARLFALSIEGVFDEYARVLKYKEVYHVFIGSKFDQEIRELQKNEYLLQNLSDEKKGEYKKQFGELLARAVEVLGEGEPGKEDEKELEKRQDERIEEELARDPYKTDVWRASALEAKFQHTTISPADLVAQANQISTAVSPFYSPVVNPDDGFDTIRNAYLQGAAQKADNVGNKELAVQLQPAVVIPQTSLKADEEMRQMALHSLDALLQREDLVIQTFGQKFIDSTLYTTVKELVSKNAFEQRSSSGTGLMGAFTGGKSVAGDVLHSVTDAPPEEFAMNYFNSFAMITRIGKKNPELAKKLRVQLMRNPGMPLPINEMEALLAGTLSWIDPHIAVDFRQLSSDAKNYASIDSSPVDYLKKLGISETTIAKPSEISSIASMRSTILFQAHLSNLMMKYPQFGSFISIAQGGLSFIPQFSQLGMGAASGIASTAASSVGSSILSKGLTGALSIGGGPAGMLAGMALNKGMDMVKNLLQGKLPFSLSQAKKSPLLWIIGGVAIFIYIFFLSDSQALMQGRVIDDQIEGGIGTGGPTIDCAKTPDIPECKLTQCEGDCKWPIADKDLSETKACITEGPFVGTHGKCHLSAIDILVPANQDALFGKTVYTQYDGVVVGMGSNLGGGTFGTQFGFNDNSGSTSNEHSQDGNTYGNHVLIKTKTGSFLLFAHLRNIRVVQDGQEVKAGDPVGYVDHTGYSGGTHLHYENWAPGCPAQNTDINAFLPFPVPPCVGSADCNTKLVATGQKACF